ncbi:MAG TPA: LuxR C-terminal-related transcriptional regulator [Kofleriaceae bacterium]|nr:LuxR C-terminal-related transcriptional regulator [Kofleriaceae bacterium]
MTPSHLQQVTTGGSFASRLRNAHNFVDVATIGCAAAQELGLHCVISLHGTNGQPSITVDNIADAPDNMFGFPTPILALDEHLGVVRWSAAAPLTPELRRELETMTMHISVRLAQLGYFAREDHSQRLTDRQNEAARLAARGYTNGEIAEELALSANTVKKHLKEVFERLGVSSRTELAVRYARLAADDGVPDGVSYRAGCTLTKHR